MNKSFYYSSLLFLIAFSCFYTSVNASNEKKIDRVKADSSELSKSISHLLKKNIKACDSLLTSSFKKFNELGESDQLELLALKQKLSWVNGTNTSFDFKVYEFDERKEEVVILKGHFLVNNNKSLDKEILNKITAIAEEKIYTYNRSEALFLLGRNAHLNDSIEKSIELLTKATEIGIRSKNKETVEKAFFEIGKIHYSNGLYERAFTFYQKALRASESNQTQLYKAKILYELGNVQLDIKNLDMAASYYGEAMSVANKIKAPIILALAESSYGLVLVSENNLNKAITYFHKSLVTFYKTNHYSGIAKTHKRLGKAYFKTQNYNLAKDNYLLGLGYARGQGDSLLMGDIHYNIAALELTAKSYSKALYHNQKAIDLRANNVSLLTLDRSYFLLAKIYSKMNKFPEAYHYLTVHIELSDSIQEKETKQQITELNRMFRSEQNERLILEQQKELEVQSNKQLLKDEELKNKELRNIQMLYLLIISLLIFLIIIAIISFKNKQTKLKQKHKASELKQAVFRAQMNPHFIFNSMSVIQGYIYDSDIKKSSIFLVNFSKLMRLILENSAKEFISLSTEIEILDRYLKIQKLRFEERFEYEFLNLEEIDTEKYAIPPMLMQPFIENAIEHGQLHLKENGKIKISFQLEGDYILFTLEDNGIGIRNSKNTNKQKDHKSMAIDITKQRIKLLNEQYKKEGFLEIIDLTTENKNGTKVIIKTVFTPYL